MLVVYRRTDNVVVSISGVRPVGSAPVPESMIYGIVPAEPLPEGQDSFYITDIEAIRATWDVWDASRDPGNGFECVVVFEEGKPVGIRRKDEAAE